MSPIRAKFLDAAKGSKDAEDRSLFSDLAVVASAGAPFILLFFRF
jgi:hypothetical protein